MDKPKAEGEFARKRKKMIDEQLKGRGISNHSVLAVFGSLKREQFMPTALQDEAYEDHPVPIGWGQTISQPYIVALMTQSLELEPTDRVLEVGTGSGYQTAILARLASEVYSIEFNGVLYEQAKLRLAELGCQNVFLKHEDGRTGWPEAAPFDKILVTAAAEEIPATLVRQLKEGGRMVIPVGVSESQDLLMGRKEKGVLVTKQLTPVRFVPLQSGSQSA